MQGRHYRAVKLKELLRSQSSVVKILSQEHWTVNESFKNRLQYSFSNNKIMAYSQPSTISLHKQLPIIQVQSYTVYSNCLRYRRGYCEFVHHRVLISLAFPLVHFSRWIVGTEIGRYFKYINCVQNEDWSTDILFYVLMIVLHYFELPDNFS